ncbi:MAG: excinuclease ABC subunit UvrC, partial [Bacteroidota bacterium]
MQFQRFTRDQYLQLPELPGIYKYLNKEHEIIYVGKAKNLKKRVASYFTKSNLENRKTHRLVKEIVDIEFVIVKSEFDALLLENNLIKENQPRYNILLKDDKSFPSILITKERFPRVYATRRIDRSLGEYYGPYSSVKAMNSVLTLIRKLYQIRTCKFNLSKKNVENGKFKVCLEYHLGNCQGPCEGHQEEEEYLVDIEGVRNILKGNAGIVSRTYKEQMQEAASELKFEVAQDLKEKLETLERFQSRSLIVNQKTTDLDVFTMLPGADQIFVNYLQIKEGSIVNSETVQVVRKLEEEDEQVFQFCIFDLRRKFNSENQEILTNVHVSPWQDITITVPKIGDKKKLVDLSVKNALYYKKELLSRASVQKENEAVKQLQDALNLTEPPNHIECFDNSNIQGTNPVAAMVCFKNGKPSKKDYRKFNIKTVVGPDDFASMTEVVGRRYKHLIEEELPLPGLILIDGGKGQLNAAVQALKELSLYGRIPIIGIAKRLEEIYVPEDPYPLHIDKKSLGLKLLQQLRDEAHRFAITFHRKKRSNQATQSSLSVVKGIGPKTQQKILENYGSLKRLKETDEQQLVDDLGQGVAKNLKEAIKKG